MEKSVNEYHRFLGWVVNSLVRHADAPRVKPEGLDVDTVLSLLKANKIPLVFIRHEVMNAFPEIFDSEKFRDEYEKEKKLYIYLRDEWSKVREEYEKSGVESMFIKSIGLFPYKSSNLDVLIKQDKRKKAESILRRMGYIQLHNVEEPYKTLFRTFKDGEPISAIHLHNKVAWVNPFHNEELLWNRYRKSPFDVLVNIPSQEDSLLILTAHWFYEDKELKLSDIINISNCLRKSNLDWDYMTGVARKMGWLNGFHFALLVHSLLEKGFFDETSTDDRHLGEMKAALPRWMRLYFDKKVCSRAVVSPFKLPKSFGKSLHFIKTLRDRTAAPQKKLYEMVSVAYGALFATLFYKFKINIRHQQPMLISISGVDGSGKTTYAKYLYDTLVFCELRTQYVWSRVGSSTFLKPFSKIAKMFFSQKRVKKIPKHFEYSENLEPGRENLFEKSLFLRSLGLFLLLLEMLWQYSYKVTLPLFLKRVVICDRYIYDTFVDTATRYGVRLNSLEGRLFTKIIAKLTPKPELAYFLNLRVEDICNRREVSFNEKLLIREQIDHYKKISPIHNLQMINNNGSVTKVREEITHETLAKYYKKWESHNILSK